MGMILRIASSRIVGQGDIVGRRGYFSLNLSANSVMRGRLDARRTLKSLVADLRTTTRFMVRKYFHYLTDTITCRFNRQFSLKKANMKWITYNIGDPQDNNCIKVENSTVTHTSINITGKNNRIIVRNGAKMFFGGIKIIGNDNEVVYDGCKAMINVFMKGNGCKITVGRGSLIDESTSIVLMGQGNRVEIGEECMFAEKVEIWASDTHLITDLQGNPLNPSKPVVIGKHVWLGKGVNVMKGVTIGEHTTVGLGSIVTKDLPPHCIAAGSPAKVVRTGTDWHLGHTNI